jgi:hypothetical protein
LRHATAHKLKFKCRVGWADQSKTKTAAAMLGGWCLALAAFIMRPQADAQIGAFG